MEIKIMAQPFGRQYGDGDERDEDREVYEQMIEEMKARSEAVAADPAEWQRIIEETNRSVEDACNFALSVTAEELSDQNFPYEQRRLLTGLAQHLINTLQVVTEPQEIVLAVTSHTKIAFIAGLRHAETLRGGALINFVASMQGDEHDSTLDEPVHDDGV